MIKHLNEKMNTKLHQTTSLYYASYLIARAIPLIGAEHSSDGKMIFIFPDSQERVRLTELYHYAPTDDPTVLVDPRKMEAAIRSLKTKIYQ